MSLPIISSADSSSIDLQPWLLWRQLPDAQAEVSLWSIEQVGTSIAVFSSYDLAERYRASVLLRSPDDKTESTDASDWKTYQPTELELGQIMVEHYRAGVKWLALDPSESAAKRLFSMAEVLKALRQRLVAQMG